MGKQKSERKKPNCKQENYACGKKCQPRKYRCPSEKGIEVNSASDKFVKIIEKTEASNLKPKSQSPPQQSLSIKTITPDDFSWEVNKLFKTAYIYGKTKLENESEKLPENLKARLGYSASFMQSMANSKELRFEKMLIAESEYSRENNTAEGYLCYEMLEQEQKEFLHVEVLATHPKNIDKNDENYLRGVGTSLIFEAMKMAKEKGVAIVLDPILSAIEFYEKLGFEKNQDLDPDEEEFPTHILSLEKIEELLKKLEVVETKT